MPIRRLALLAALAPYAATALLHAQTPRPLRTRNIVLIVSDGVRWQEVFHGAAPALMTRSLGHVEDTLALRNDFARATTEEQRVALMPFLWQTIARRGQIYGDLDSGSSAQVTNSYWFSYPGYNEMLTGAADPRVNSNSLGRNPDTTIFERLDADPALHASIAAFGTWNAFGDIFNRDRAHVPVWAGWEVPFTPPASRAEGEIDAFYRTTTHLWDDLAYDSFMQRAVLDYVQTRHPRVLFVGYGETDEWAHMGRYDQVLRSLHSVDAFVGELWRTMQAIPQYRGTTTFIITTDHGRGSGPTAWRDHGPDVPGAQQIWIAVLGPDTPALGVRAHVERATQSQIAATLAAFLGENWRAMMPAAAPPIAAVLQP